MKKALYELKKAEAATDRIEKLFDSEPENDELDELWMNAYKKEHESFKKLANEIVKASYNMIDTETAEKIIRMKREKLEELINRLA